jgi:N-carbamoylputrescine amidase
MKVTVCQLDNRPLALDPMLEDLAAHIAQESSAFLLLPEMCFHEWLAADAEPESERWLAAVDAHARYLSDLDKIGAKAVIGSRPIVNEQGDFRNQAYLWTPQSGALPVHDKYYLPNEASYWEANWYQRGELGFDHCEALDMRIGVQICTEMWFFEWARHFAAAGVDILCIPRATPHGTSAKWLAGGQATAVCAGAYCLSSNLWNPPDSKADCGGLGWIISPEGDVLAQTNEAAPFATAEIDLEFARRSKQTYPRYVAE